MVLLGDAPKQSGRTGRQLIAHPLDVLDTVNAILFQVDVAFDDQVEIARRRASPSDGARVEGGIARRPGDWRDRKGVLVGVYEKIRKLRRARETRNVHIANNLVQCQPRVLE